MSNTVNQFILSFLGYSVKKSNESECQVSCGCGNIICQNVIYSALQNVAGMILRWAVNVTGIGAVILWLFNNNYANPENDAQSPTQAVAKTYLANRNAEKEQDSQKKEKHTQNVSRHAGKWGFSVRQR
jgi:hypothetical protein